MIARALRLVALAVVTLAGCATEGSSNASPRAWVSSAAAKVSSLTTGKGERQALITELTPGPYEASSLAVGEEKDLAQHRGEGLGFVRVTPLERYLADARGKLVAASGVTGVPGRVVILANPGFVAYSVPDGNVYVSMGWLEYLENEDEVAAILAHELSHVLLKHHSADLAASTQHKAQALYEIGVAAKSSFASSKTKKADARTVAEEQLAGEVTDRLAVPAWSRRQEREADLLGVDLLVRAGWAPDAMVTMLEKLQAWEKKTKESDEAFWDRVGQTAQSTPGDALKMTYDHVLDAISKSHPKTDERIGDVAQYLERHYGDLVPVDPKIESWKAVAATPEVAEVMRHYDIAFSGKKMLDAGKTAEAYGAGKAAATGRTAKDAYPNWVLARAAALLGRQRESLDALQRALTSPEPVPEIYEVLITDYERAGNLKAALTWTDKASTTFGGAPRWTPIKIRLLRKAGRTTDASALTLSCSVNTPEWRRLCQTANETPAGRPQG